MQYDDIIEELSNTSLVYRNDSAGWVNIKEENPKLTITNGNGEEVSLSFEELKALKEILKKEYPELYI